MPIKIIIRIIMNKNTSTVSNRIGETIRLQYGRIKPTLPEIFYKDILGIPKKTFGKYIANTQQPRLDELERIAKWLKISPKDLF